MFLKKYLLAIVFIIISPSLHAQIMVEMDSISVTASRITSDISESGKSVSVYTSSDIERLPVTSVDDLLRYLPGVNLNSRGGFGVQTDVGIRGTTFSQVLFLLDNTPLNDPLTGHYNTNIPVSLSEIGQIELIRGPASASFGGDAVGGVVHIKTKMFMEREITRAGAGETLTSVDTDFSFGQHQLTMADGGADIEKGRWRFSISGRDSRSDGENISNPAFVEGISGEEFFNTHFRLSNVSLAGSARFSDRLSAYVRAGYDERSFNARYFYTRSIYDESTEDITSKWVLSSVAYSLENHQFDVQASFRNMEDVFDFNPNVSPANAHTTGKYFLNASHSTAFSGRLLHAESIKLLSGVQFQHSNIESTDRGNHSDRTTGLYSVATFSWNSGLNLTGSGRLEANRNNSLSFLPQLSASYQTGAVTYRSSVGRAIRFGDFTERFVSFNLPELTPLRNIGNPDLKPETSVTFDIGADWRPIPSLRFSPTFFIRSSKNLIDYTLTSSDEIDNVPNLLPGEDYFYANNIASAVTAGFEFHSVFNFLESSTYSGNANLGYTYLKTTDDGASVSRYIANHPSHQIQGGANLVFSRLSVHSLSSFHVRSPQADELAGATIPKSYFVSNLKISLDLFSDQVRVYTHILNITNTSYQEILGAPMPKRWLRAGIQLTL